MNLFFTRISKLWCEMTLGEKALFYSVSAVLTLLMVFLALIISGKTGLLIVQSGSMQKTMPPGTLLVFKAAKVEDIQTGDIIAFRENRFSGSLITHRAAGKTYEKDELYIKTKGDSNHRADTALVGKDELVGRIIYIIPGAGRAVAITKTPVGMLILNLTLVLLISLIIFDKARVSGKRSYNSEDEVMVSPRVLPDSERMA